MLANNNLKVCWTLAKRDFRFHRVKNAVLALAVALVTGLYAFAGSDDYYDKSGYLTVALAPILTFGVLFAAILPLVPQGWFWVVYLLQVINLSGAAGDLFVTVRFARLPKDIAVRDCGVSMTVYSKSEC